MGACSPPGTAKPSTKTGWLASCPSSPSLVSSSLYLARARAGVKRRMRAADGSVRSKLFEAACRTFLTPTAILSVSGEILSVRDVVHKLHAIQWYIYMYVPGSTEVRRKG